MNEQGNTKGIEDLDFEGSEAQNIMSMLENCIFEGGAFEIAQSKDDMFSFEAMIVYRDILGNVSHAKLLSFKEAAIYLNSKLRP